MKKLSVKILLGLMLMGIASAGVVSTGYAHGCHGGSHGCWQGENCSYYR